MRPTSRRRPSPPLCLPAHAFQRIATLLLVALTVFLATDAALYGQSTANRRAPNIVLIMSDDK